MTQKAEEKFHILWTTFKEARALRTGADDAPWIATSEAWASFVLTEEGAEIASAHLDALSRERRAFKRLLRHAKRHGSDMLPTPAEAEIATPAPQEPKPARTSRRPVGDGARAVRAKAGRPAPKAPPTMAAPAQATRTKSGSAKPARLTAKPARAAPSTTVRDSSAKPGPSKRTTREPSRAAKAPAPAATAHKTAAVSPKTTSKAVGEPKKRAAVATPLPAVRRRPRAAPPKS